MIRYRPRRRNITAELKDEQVFDSVEDVQRYVWDKWSRVCNYIGPCEPFRLEEVQIGEVCAKLDLAAYKDVRPVCVTRIGDAVFTVPECIGWCGE